MYWISAAKGIKGKKKQLCDNQKQHFSTYLVPNTVESQAHSSDPGNVCWLNKGMTELVHSFFFFKHSVWNRQYIQGFVLECRQNARLHGTKSQETYNLPENYYKYLYHRQEMIRAMYKRIFEIYWSIEAVRIILEVWEFSCIWKDANISTVRKEDEGFRLL